MSARFHHRITFQIERFLLGGTFYHLLFIALIVMLVSVAGGLLGLWLTTDFRTAREAMWWAFLHLTDSGYLGEDQGVGKRTISTVLTVSGYVLFTGALIATMTQWLHETVTRLQSGLTPIFCRNHFLVLGWSDRTPGMVEQLLLSRGRVERFLKSVGAEKLHIVILAESIGPHLIQALKDHLGPAFKERQVTLRSGTPLQMDHLERVDFRRAAVILLPAEAGQDAVSSSDSRVIKTLVSVGSSEGAAGVERLPLMVAEIGDVRNIPVARRAYRGPIEILPVDQIAGRLLAQNLRHRGLSHVFAELFSPGSGNRIFVRECPSLAGQPYGAVSHFFPAALLLGLIETQDGENRPLFGPPAETVLKAEHRFIFLARRFEDGDPQAATVDSTLPWSTPPDDTAPARPPHRRVLVMGWNVKAAALLRELDGFEDETLEVCVLSTLPRAQRERMLALQDAIPRRLRVQHVEGNFTCMSDLLQVNPAAFDRILLLASDRLESDAESAARSVHGYLVLQEVLGAGPHRPSTVVELTTTESLAVFQSRGDEVLVTPILLSHVSTQVALRRELRCVFEALFGPGGPEVFFQPARHFSVPNRPVTFRDIQRQAASQGGIALGLRVARERSTARGGIRLNPDKDLAWKLEPQDEIIVIQGR